MDDDEIVNAFALPGGQICITEAMFEQLKSKDQLAAILAHETAHVVSRHSAEQIAKQQLRQGLTGAAVIATYDPQNVEDRARMATLLGELASMKFSREDESEADILGLELLSRAEYPPESMLDVMEILEKNRRGGYPEFMSTHPSPVNRAKKIRRAIEELSQRQNS